MNERELLLRDLRALDFVIQETTLYLDGHPEDAEALRYRRDRVTARNALAERYEQRFGPLSIYGTSPAGEKWQWVSAPWPWEEGGN